MPNIKSKKKSVQRQRANRARNVGVRSAIKTLYKKAVSASAGGSADAPERQRQTQKLVDKAWKRGIMHKNAAARKKSRLAKAVAGAAASSKG